MPSNKFRIASRLEALQTTMNCLLLNLDTIPVCYAQNLHMKQNQSALSSFANQAYLCSWQQKQATFLWGTECPWVLLRTDSAAMPVAASTRHNTRRSRAPSVIFCNVTDVASRLPHAPEIIHRWKPPALCWCAPVKGATDAERAPRQFCFSFFFPLQCWQSDPVPSSSTAPFLATLDLFLESNVMIVADFENLEMHLLRLIAELLCTALSGTFGLLFATLWFVWRYA